MALNTIHARNKDLINAFNETQKKPFKCELVDDVTSERVMKGLNLGFPSVKLTIRINGHADIKDRDKIKVLNKHFVAIRVLNKFDNQLQARKRADFEFFVGSCLVFLE